MLKRLILGFLIMANLNAKYSNKLINEDSPYLLQHAHNPVAWYPWGDEAFEKARKEDKLIFLSIGYSTCHWCHVMERESFENESVADILNKDFVAIKLDREEYPHIDRHYQEIYTLMNRRGGGWPLTIVMTPEAKTFFSATYLPPEDRYGRSGLKGILHMLDNAYKTRQEDVLKSVNSIESALRRMENSQQGKQVTLDMSIAQDFVKILASNFDQTYKGFGSAPKFPNATTLDVLLDVYRITDNETALNISTQTLLAMSNGGIYDQIEGGFYRYSVDEKWIIPHFEKMLYTNAELLEGYANAYALTKEPRFKEVIMQTVHNIHERFEKDAMYYSASDADSDANEGKYFVFDFKESFQDLIEGELSKENAKNILAYYSIDAEGNFEENKTNPHLSGLEIPHNLHKGTKILRANRAKKNYPFIDFKIQTSWNALYLRGLFKAAKYVDNTYAQTALSALDSLLNHLYIDGVLYHQVIVGKKPKVKAYLEDYAFLISVLVDAYQINFDESYITLANRFIEEAVMNFYKNGRWYMSNDDFKAGAEFYDASYRSALAVMIEALFQVAALSDNLKLDAFAKHSLEAELSALKVNPNQYPYGLKTYLQSQLSYVVIKSTKENLLANRDMLNNIRYPYILLKPSEDAKFLACKIESCFALDEKLTKVIDKIQKVMK